jgi:hypothetical protein
VQVSEAWQHRSPAKQKSRHEGRTQMVHIGGVNSGISLSDIDAYEGSALQQ